MTKQDLLEKLEVKVGKTLRFINEVLFPRNDVNRDILDKYKVVLNNYLKSKNIDTLHQLKDLHYRPTPEGSQTDYTEGTGLAFDGKHTTLSDLLMEIEDLIVIIRKN